MQRLNYLLIPGLTAVFLFVGISEFESGTEQVDDAGVAVLDYDAVSEGINSVLYDSDGSISYTLQADRQVHFNDDSTEIDRPLIRLFRAGDSRWNIVANSGRISSIRPGDSADARTIELSGNVEINGLDEFGNRTVMTTEFLTVDPEQEILETDQPLTLVTTNLRQTSIGMFADLKIDEFVFHRDIEGRYEQIRN